MQRPKKKAKTPPRPVVRPKEGPALYAELQSATPLNQATAAKSPEEEVLAIINRLKIEAVAAQRQLLDAQEELTKLVNIGLTGDALMKLCRQLEVAVSILQRCGLKLPSGH